MFWIILFSGGTTSSTRRPQNGSKTHRWKLRFTRIYWFLYVLDWLYMVVLGTRTHTLTQDSHDLFLIQTQIYPVVMGKYHNRIPIQLRRCDAVLGFSRSGRFVGCITVLLDGVTTVVRSTYSTYYSSIVWHVTSYPLLGILGRSTMESLWKSRVIRRTYGSIGEVSFPV